MLTRASRFIPILCLLATTAASAATSADDAKPEAAKPTLWSLQPVVDPPVPEIRDANWSRNPIDRFIRAKLDERGLTPAPDADRATLLRRVTFDLTGLPPTPDELDAFAADASPDAFTKVVDRLLASPRYGERWGRHWLDVARYADTAGDNADYPVPEARLYRDYVIDSFNADKPYDQFVREQLAGDLLAADGPPEKRSERIAATGFVALSRRYATAPYEFHFLTIEDSIETTGRAFLGMTFRCARCHDHKFDPVSMADYYAMYGVFANTQYPYAGSEEFASKGSDRAAFVPLLPPEQAGPRLAGFLQKQTDLQAQIASLGTDESQQAKREAIQAELKLLKRPGLPADVPGAYAIGEAPAAVRVGDVAIQLRGDPAQPGAIVHRGVPKSLGGDVASATIPDGISGRLQFANWIASKDNPLTARVMVNRIWQHHFGRGIVATPSNFGVRGEPPTHPELLDYLAARFVESGWSVKAMHRLILASRTYQLASVPARPAGETASAVVTPAIDPRTTEDPDPANLWLSRASRRRLDAEALRDAMLFVSGNLDSSRPDGPHPFPPIEHWGWTQHAPFKAVYPSNRRSVYLMTQRLVRHPYLSLFDSPDTNTSADDRTSATVPSQALFLMNNPFVREQAEAFARWLNGAGPDTRGRVALACRVAWGRTPENAEVDGGTAYVARYVEELTRAGATPEQAHSEAWVSYAKIVLTSNEFLYLD